MPVYVARILVCTWWWPRAAIVCAAVGVECAPNLVSAAKADGVLTGGEYCICMYVIKGRKKQRLINFFTYCKNVY
jgi:hypothetical protein